jgi:transposase
MVTHVVEDRKESQMQTRILGIDLAVTANHKAAILDPATGQYVVRQRSFRAVPDALDKLLSKARQGVEGEVHLVCVLEATGMSWYPVGLYLHRQGVTVYRVNGRQTKELRKVSHPHNRSDGIDATVLARLYTVAKEHMVPWHPPSGEQLALQRWCKTYDRLRIREVALQNRLKAYDQSAWGGFHKLVPREALAWVRQEWYDPWQVTAKGLDELRAIWNRQAESRVVGDEWLAAWVQRATQMTQLYGSPAYFGYDYWKADVRHLLEELTCCQKEQATLVDQRILPMFNRLYPQTHLESIVGVGALSAAIYMAFIQRISRFPDLQAFRKWTGMVPAGEQSGNRLAKGLGLTQAGPDLIKATLYQNANVARQWDVQLAQIYHRQMETYGKHHTQAVCAVASHLVNRIWAVLTQNRPYQLLDLQGNPISPADARQFIQTHFTVSNEVRQRTNVRSRTTDSD